MTRPATPPPPAPHAPPSGTPPRPPPRTPRGLKILLAVVAIVAALIVGLRIFTVTRPGRALVTGIANGRSLGRFGRLGVQGLHGDILSGFTLDRVTLADARGVWLVARQVQVRWSPLGLFGRVFRAESVSAASIDVLRRPQLPPPTGPSRALPVSIEIGRFTSQVQLMPALAKRYGRWSVAGDLDLIRNGPDRGGIQALSLTRPGDFLQAGFDMGERGRMRLRVRAREAKGGSLAGALGYSPDQPFVVDVKADGVGGRGAFYASAVSGPYTPVRADGDWTPQGGRAEGVISFAGSDLLKPLLGRLGPQAGFRLTLRRAQDGRFATALDLQTETLQATAQGRIALSPFGAPAGVAIQARTPSLSRLMGRPLAGPASFQGSWTGALQAWRLQGGLSAQAVRLDGEQLASAAGPVEVRFDHGGANGQVRLQGEGGAGRSLVARLLGARPLVDVAFNRLADGRLILQRLDLTGSDLSVRGRGARSLLGAYSFQGQAAIPRLADLRQGAHGALTADWKAAETGRGRPWSVAFDAKGRNFASGLGQLDRLLGRAPRLTAAGRYAGGVITVAASTLSGAAGRAAARGTAALNGAVNLKLDWSAQGPFQAGPVTLAGNLRGSGGLTGALDRPRLELTSHLDRVDLPDLSLADAVVDLAFAKGAAGWGGDVSITAASAWGPAKARSQVAFTPEGVRLDQLALDAGGITASGAVTLSRAGPSQADLTFKAGPGAFLTQGSAQGAIRLTTAAGAQAMVQVEASDLAVRGAPYVLRSLKLDGRGPLGHLPFRVEMSAAGAVPASFAGTGVYAHVGRAQTVSLSGLGKLRGVAWRTLAPAVFSLAPGVRSASADLGVGQGRLTAAAREDSAGLAVKANVVDLSLATFESRLTGEVNGALTASGRGGAMNGTLDARLTNLRDRDAPETGALNAEVRAGLAGGRLQLAATGRDTKGGAGTLQLALPVVASAQPLHLAIARTQPISGRFSLQGEARPYWSLFMDGEDDLAGQVSAQGVIAGTLAAPAVTGQASLAKGGFEDARTGLRLRDMTVSLAFSHETAVVQTFRADDGRGGSVTGQGRVELARGGASSFTLDLSRFQVLDRDEAQARASGRLTVTRAVDGKMQLAGKLQVDRAVISPNPPTPSGVVKLDVIEINRPPGRGQSFAPPSTGPPIELDISLNAPGQVLVQGRGLNIDLSLNAHIGGTARDPALTGKATVIRGDYTFAGKRFDLNPGGVVDLSTHVQDIRLNLEAVYNPPTGGLTANVFVTGTAAKPDIKLTSTPSLPQDEILSQILFGTSASQLTTAQAAQIGAATASMATGGGLDVLSNLGKLAGLDVLSLGAVGSSLTVTGGKYVGSNLYLEVVGGGQGGTSVQADWRVLKNLSVVSQIAGQGYSRISVYWRKDFH